MLNIARFLARGLEEAEMKARVKAFESGKGYSDGKPRVVLYFHEAELYESQLKIAVDKLPDGIAIDSELEVALTLAPQVQA